MNDKSSHLLQTLTDDDWQQIITSLKRHGTPRSVELAHLLTDWRIEVSRVRVALLQAFSKLQ